MDTASALGWVTTMIDALDLRGLLIAGVILVLVVGFVQKLTDKG